LKNLVEKEGKDPLVYYKIPPKNFGEVAKRIHQKLGIYYARSAKGVRKFLDSAHFSNFETKGVTDLRNGFSMDLGSVTDALLEKVKPGEIINFLEAAEIISTYIHVSSIVMHKETDEDGVFIMEGDGTETFYTNKATTYSFKFKVKLDRNEGNTITVFK